VIVFSPPPVGSVLSSGLKKSSSYAGGLTAYRSQPIDTQKRDANDWNEVV